MLTAFSAGSPVPGDAQQPPHGSPGEALVDELAEPSEPSPFDGRVTLDAHALRGLRPGVVAEILAAPPGGPIAVASLAMPLPAVEGQAAVALFVEIDGASFLDTNQARTARVEVYAYALTADGRVAGYLADVFVVAVAEFGEAIWQSGLKYFGRLELPPGDYRLRILVRNFQSGARGVEELALTVLVPTGAPRLTALFPEPPSRDVWLPVRGWALWQGDAGWRYPFVAAGRALDPAARPVLVSGRRARAHLLVSGLAGGELVGSLQILGERRGAEVVIAESELELQRAGTEPDGSQLITATLVAPELAPGRHRFRLALGRRGESPAYTAPGSLLAAAASIQDRELLWSDLRWLLSAPEKAPEARPPRGQRKRQRAERERAARRRRALAESYRGVLREVVEATAESAGAALFEVESEALGRLAGSPLQGLRETELAVAAQLGRAGVEALLPIVMVHSSMYPRYRSRHSFSLLVHTREVVEALAHLYVELGGRTEIAASVLVSLGGYVQEANLHAASRRLFTAALDYDPENAGALVGLAASYEKYGEYRRAVTYLEPLVAAHPSFGEGVLRLAVNLARVGLGQRARQLLRSLVEGSEVGWVRAVAYQELARSYLKTAELERAAEVLEEALRELPERHGNRFLLAHVYDRLGRSGAALDSLLSVTPAPAGAASERLIYDSSPRAAVDRARDEIGLAAAGALATLAGALGDASTATGEDAEPAGRAG